VLFSDTWEWDGSAWTQIAVTGPSGRYFPGMAYDPVRQRIVLCGGLGPLYPGGVMQTWEWDGESWTDFTNQNDTVQGGDYPFMAFDEERGIMVLSSARSTSSTWERLGTTWVHRPISSTIACGGITYDPSRRKVVAINSPTAEWTGTQWVTIAPTGPTSIYSALFFDPVRNRLTAPLGASTGLVPADAWTLNPAIGPTITRQPESTVACPSRQVVLQVDGSGTRVNYQWKRNGQSITGERNPVLIIENWTSAHLGTYTCTVSNSCGSVTSAPVQLVAGTDFNGDRDHNTDADIESFFACLAGNCCSTCGGADFNGDGTPGTDADIESFFRVLAGGNC
jgi:hypothetical protein